MPAHKVHRRIAKALTGDSHDEVHKAIDAPYGLLGRRHRWLFHGLLAPIIGALSAQSKGKDPASGAAAGVSHIAADWSQTGLRKGLKLLGIGRKRRRRKKGWLGLLGL